MCSKSAQLALHFLIVFTRPFKIQCWGLPEKEICSRKQGVVWDLVNHHAPESTHELEHVCGHASYSSIPCFLTPFNRETDITWPMQEKCLLLHGDYGGLRPSKPLLIGIGHDRVLSTQFKPRFRMEPHIKFANVPTLRFSKKPGHHSRSGLPTPAIRCSP